ncbi:uncharacterized protein LOC117234625 [Bombus vosnesenskii]|uniref:Uncharacterized protein LOC117234625 n=1 Tax=Bombus vosnesenskii TaxID=207650 RepID=A0A6J3KFM3_9HYME|nr:uncharacterized protein LOC117234625 [Bombus vosnesenskii]
MSCKKFCYYRKTRLTEDSECLTPALEIFTRAHRLLKNFMDLYKIHEGKCCGVNYDTVPLHGALDIVATAMTSIVCGNVKKGSQRSGLFRNMFPCVRCQDMEVLPEEIVRKVDIIMTCLERCCAIENITRRIKDVLCILERLAPCAMSEKFQTLSLLLKEIMRKLICCGQDLEEPFGNTQTKLILNLVNNFIRDWSEKRSGSRPCLRICRFCDRVVNETTRQWGTFCCNEAKKFHDIRIEWILRQSITSDASKDEAIDWRPKSKSSRNERFDDDSRTYASVEISRAVDVTDYDDSSARFDERTSVKENLESPDRTIKHRSAGEIGETRRAEAEVFSKKTKIERYDDSSREWDKFDRAEGRDLTKTAAGTLEGKMRGKIKRNRDIDRTGEYPITPDGREERDDVPYKSKLDKIRGSRGLRDTNEERAAAGKMKKIKRDAKYLSQKRLEYTEFSETESEATGVHRSREGDKGVSVITKKSPKERRKNKLHGHTLVENERKKMVEKTTDTDIEEKTTGRRNRKKPRTEEDIELNEMTDTSERKEADGRKKKKADAFDNGKKVVSYTFDKEDKVLKSGGTQDGRSSNERNETESILTKKHRDVKRGVSSAEDKSTLDSENQNKKETSKSSKKEHRRSGSDRTEDNSSKTYGSRYHKKRAIFSDIQIDDRSPIEYQLSNQHFVKLGWTVLPVAKTMRKIIQYRAKPSKPGLDWFGKHKLNGRMYYDDEARIFVNFHTGGSAEVFYPNGEMAIKLQRPQNRKCNYRSKVSTCFDWNR